MTIGWPVSISGGVVRALTVEKNLRHRFSVAPSRCIVGQQPHRTEDSR